MKLRKFISVMCAAALAGTMLAGAAGCRNKANELAPLKYADDRRLELGAFNAPYQGFSKQSYFDDLADAGISLLVHPAGFTTASQRELLLEGCKAAGLRTTVHDPNLVAGINGAGPVYELNGGTADGPAADIWDASADVSYKDHPAFFALHVMDEPYRGHLKYLKEKTDNIKEVFGGNKNFYVNLAPGYFNTGTYRFNSIDDWKAYVREYMELVRPGYISFDYYPLLRGGAVRSSYFTEFDYITHIAKEYGAEFWPIILASGHEPSVYKAELDIEDLRWQMAVAQTYGARVITHYAYAPGNDTYDAFITDKGRRAPLFDRVKTVNLEARKWDHVYLNFEWLGVAPIKGPFSSILLDAFEKNEEGEMGGHALDPDKIEGIVSITATDDALLGCFEDAQGNKGFLLTNASNPADPFTPEVTIKFAAGYRGVQVYEKGTPRVYNLDKDGKIKIALNVGEGRFLIPLK